MLKSVKPWLDRGVAGFRLDAIPELVEDAQLRNETETGGLNDQGDPNLAGNYQFNQPEAHDVLHRLRAMVDKYSDDRVLIGETYVHSTAALDQWYGGPAHDELQLPMDTQVGFGSFNAPRLRQLIEEAETELHGSQPLFVFDNHDNIRSMDRLGDGVHNLEIAKAVATVLLTSRATALTYYGAPIGITTTTPQRKEDVRDPEGVSGWPKDKGRDGERTPMQWTPGPQAGFSSNPHTWLPIAPNYKTINVESESADPDSLLNWYKNLIELRRANPALRDGGMVMLNADNKDVLCYMRTAPEWKTLLGRRYQHLLTTADDHARSKAVWNREREDSHSGDKRALIAGSSVSAVSDPPTFCFVGGGGSVAVKRCCDSQPQLLPASLAAAFQPARSTCRA